MGGDELARNKAFTSFPRVEASCCQDRQCLVVTAGLVVESHQLNREIVPLVHQIAALFQSGQPIARRHTCTFPQLVELVEQAGIGGGGGGGTRSGGARGGRAGGGGGCGWGGPRAPGGKNPGPRPASPRTLKQA